MGKLSITNRQLGNVVVLDVVGRLTLGEETLKLRDSIAAVIDTGRKQLLANMAGVDYVDSSGIGELVSANAMATRNGASLKLVGLRSRLQGLLEMTKLNTVFETFDTESDAVRSFATRRR